MVLNEFHYQLVKEKIHGWGYWSNDRSIDKLSFSKERDQNENLVFSLLIQKFYLVYHSIEF